MPKENKSKSNKTAHVLNLLTDTDTITENGEEKEEKAAPAPERADDSHVEEQIRSALEKDLLGDEKPAAEPQPEPTPAAEPEPTPEAKAAPEVEAEPAPAPEAEPEAAVEPEAEAKPEPEAAAEETKAETDAFPDAEVAGPLMAPAVMTPVALSGISCINVMQAIVEEKVDKYIKLFGLCTCARCKIDVMALSLTNLPAKYVVVRENETIPMLSVYEGRYNAAVISQVMWACKKVLDNPRHDKK